MGNKKEHIIINILLITVLLFILTFIQIKMDRKMIVIEGLSAKNEESYGNDVRVLDVRVNGRSISDKEMKFSAGWEKEGDVFVALNPQEPVWIKMSINPGDSFCVIFQKQVGSGLVRITENGEILDEIDLYSKEWTNYEYQMANQEISKTEQIRPFIAFFLFLIILVIVSNCFLNKALAIYRRKHVHKFNGKYIDEGILLLGAVTLTLCVEMINQNLQNIEMIYFIVTVVIWYVAMLILYLVYIPSALAVFIISIIGMGLGVVNHYVTIFRGNALSFSDFFVVKTALSVAENYKYSLTRHIVIAITIWTLCFMILYVMQKEFSTKIKRRKSYSYIIAILLLVFVMKSNVYDPELNLWQPEKNIENYGITVNFYASAKKLYIKEPADYSKEAIVAKYQKQDKDEKLFSPNVIVVMNEAFSDLSGICDLLNNNEYMPYYNSLDNNAIKGMAYVSIIGGLTANSEFEFLTGNSLMFLNSTVPYQQYSLKDVVSLPGILKERGYQTTAIHPYAASGFNRENVYSHLGFEKFLDITCFKNPELVRERYISDRESYKKIIEVFEENKNNGVAEFIFNVTMQNHSDYNSGYFGENTLGVPGYEGEFPEIEEYLTLIKESDAAFDELVQYFKQEEEPTVILLFGDHQPAVSDEFWEKTAGYSVYSGGLESIQKRYEVPFLIWSNYDIAEKEGIYTSLNYLSSILFDEAGLTLSPYQNYLLEFSKEIPAMNKNGYLCSEGKWHTYGEQNDHTERIEEYWQMVYYHMFEKDVTWKDYE